MADAGEVNDRDSDSYCEEISNGLNSTEDRDYSDSLYMSPVIVAHLQRRIGENNAPVLFLLQGK